jgi:hypothetical protein
VKETRDKSESHCMLYALTFFVAAFSTKKATKKRIAHWFRTGNFYAVYRKEVR